MSDALLDAVYTETEPAAAWGIDLKAAVCEHCQWRFLIPAGAPAVVCPHCCRGQLEILPGGLQAMPHPNPPELVAPFEMTLPQMDQHMRAFASSVPFAPKDLRPDRLRQRAQPVYLPMWLVDSSIAASWKAEMGYKYEVVSHQELYWGETDHWVTQEVQEPRTRWEQRFGRLARTYQNLTIPAVDDHADLEQKLGPFSLKQVLPYHPDSIQQAAIRLPDNAPNDIWNEAALALQKAASIECMHACEADKIREFRWKARYARPNWSLLLLPVYASHYQDDQGRRHPVLFHGQTGKAMGKGKSSIRQASITSVELFLAGLALFLLGLLLDSITSGNPTLRFVSMSILLIGVAGIIAAVVPPIIAWDYNHKQKLQEYKEK